MNPRALDLSKRHDALIALALAARFKGPPVPPGSEIVAAFAFSFATASPVNLGAIAGGSIFNRAILFVETAFDDASATVELGPASSPGALLGPSDSALSVVGQYESTALLVVAAPDFLRLTISPGGSTRGAGLVLWKVLP